MTAVQARRQFLTRRRETFNLIYYGGLTQEQAAEALVVAVLTAKRRWRDARLALSDERRITA